MFAESFALVEHISTNCSPNVTPLATWHNLKEGCGIAVNGREDPGSKVFVTETSCVFAQVPDAADPNPSMDALCYQGTFILNAAAFSS